MPVIMRTVRTQIIAKKTKSNLRNWYTFAGPLGQVVYNRRYFFAWKDGCLIGTYNTFEEATRYAMESVAAESNTAMVYKGVWPMIRYIKGVGKSILVDEVFY